MTVINEHQPETDSVKQSPLARRVFGGTIAGAIVGALGVLAWVLINNAVNVEMGWVAIPIGALIGLAVAVGASSTSRIGVPLLAVVITLLSSVAADNFLQRAHLVDGIAALQAQWEGLRIDIPQAPAPSPSTEGGSAADEPTTVPAATCPANVDLVPPPEIVKILPIEAYDCMSANILAVILNDVPAELVPKLPPQLKADAEALIAADAAAAKQDQAKSDLAKAKETFAGTEYDIPKPVLVCAPPPDFTQPTAQAGLGFPNGVPLILPLGDLFQKDLVRGDGQTYEPASPVCFARENAKEHPVQAASWGIGAILAGVMAFLRRRKVKTADTFPTH